MIIRNKRYQPEETSEQYLIRKHGKPLAWDDFEIARRAEQKILSIYRYGVCHLASLGRGRSGKLHEGRHMYNEVKECSDCAERGLLHSAEEAGDEILVMATVLRMKDEDGGKTRLITPCGRCREQILTYAPECDIIITAERHLWKVSLEAIHAFPIPFSFECVARPEVDSQKPEKILKLQFDPIFKG